MAIKPILFNTEMVRANKDGSKKATRRIMKPQPRGHAALVNRNLLPETIEAGTGAVYAFEDGTVVAAPYAVGDILYVRETWSQAVDFPETSEKVTVYAADFTDKELANLKDRHFRWRPSIHMPKELARIFRRVTDVRPERLCRMEIEDYIKEGVKPRPLKRDGCRCQWETEDCHLHPCTNRDAYETLEYAIPFGELWDSMLSPADRQVYGYNANPWVWVIEYEQCEKPEGF